MERKDDVRERILDALDARGAALPCALCRKKDTWSLSNWYATLLTYENPLKIQIGGNVLGYPCAILTCTNCGNTHLKNLIELGLNDLFKKEE
jgi:hypothetical protein